MSSSLIKANYANIEGKDKKRVIDSNQAVISRLSVLEEIMARTAGEQEDFADDFTEGIDAQQIDALLSDNEPAPPSQEEIDAIINEANEKAESIIREANENADNIISAAKQEAESIQSKAYDEGRKAGEKAGYEEGLKKTAAMEDEIADRGRALEEEYEQKIKELEPRFVEKLTDIYSHIFNVDLSDRTELILYLLKDAINNSAGGKSFFVHVSEDDFEYVNEHRDELAAGLASSCVLEIITDVSLSKSRCFIECEGGIFDCSLETELENLKKELRLLSYR